MRIAVLNDVHGNLAALEAVLAEPDVAAADLVLLGGDVVPGPEPAQVLELVRGLGRRARWLRGNGEREVWQAHLTRDMDADDVAAWTKRRLDVRDLARMRELPLAIELDGTIFCHATPTDDGAFFTPLTSDADVLAAVAPVSSGLLVVGHTHSQFDRRIGELRIVNPGSVGLPYEGSPAARWALLDGPQVYLRATQYDVGAAIATWEASGFPAAEEWAGWLRDNPSAESVALHFEGLRAARG
jgi:predicted phosphodiesterase